MPTKKTDTTPQGNEKNQNSKKRKRTKMSEEEICKAEALLLDSNRQPQDKEDYEKLVFQSPLSSMAWLGYASFHLEHGDVVSARSVLERALKRIPVIEKQEVQNIWFSYVNMESMYGGSVSLTATVKRFKEQNDTFAAYNHLLKVFERCRKLEDADDIGHTMTTKFRSLPQAWTSYASFLYSAGKVDDARLLAEKSKKQLDKQQQVEASIQFAKLEYKNGANEHGNKILENLVATYPKRTDIWAVYIDAVEKLGDNALTRELYERVTSLDLPEKKMKFLQKKYFDFKNKTE